MIFRLLGSYKLLLHCKGIFTLTLEYEDTLEYEEGSNYILLNPTSRIEKSLAFLTSQLPTSVVCTDH
jgi:hypothetical protein